MESRPVLVIGGEGYVGSAVSLYLRNAGHSVRVIDLGWRGQVRMVSSERRSYQTLTEDELSPFGAVVFLAGHSSVSACNASPREAFANNVAGFAELVHKLQDQKLIFASSIAVYVNTRGRTVVESEPLPEAVSFYDLHKQAIESYARLAYANSYALRFGSVCGPSPNMRTELLLNSLVLSAVRTGNVKVANAQVNRPLLGLGDLCRAVEAVISQPVPPGRYNLASVNVRVGEVADLVARKLAATVEQVESPTCYDIRVDTRAFSQASGLKFRDDLENLIDALVDFYFTHPELGKGME